MRKKLDFLKTPAGNGETEREDLLYTNYRPSNGGIGDFCLAKAEDGWHLFHIYREFDQPVDCHSPGQEYRLGHAVSRDLSEWSWQEPSICARKGLWDSAHLWAPAVVYKDDMWYMLYTGMGDEICQKIGVAVSKDLWTWDYPVDGPVINACDYSWAAADPASYTNCRDPYIARMGDLWACYYTAKSNQDQAVMGIAVSSDLIQWKDQGYVLERPECGGENGGTYMIESPCVFRRGDLFYLVYNQGYGIRYIVSDSPEDFNNRPVHKLVDGCYNFEILDTDTGLFAYANGGYYSSLCFGYVDFRENLMLIKAIGEKNKG